MAALRRRPFDPGPPEQDDLPPQASRRRKDPGESVRRRGGGERAELVAQSRPDHSMIVLAPSGIVYDAGLPTERTVQRSAIVAEGDALDP